MMKTRTINGKTMPAIGFGCMNVSHAYGGVSHEEGFAVIQRAYDVGVRHFDTAALYGQGRNEKLVGEALKHVRQDIFLASKCVMTFADGKKNIDGSPASMLRTLDNALQSLQTDHIDLYYMHRLDFNVPIEESIGALATAVAAGKIGAIGLSEVSADTIARAHAEHPIAALQSEYSLWTRNPEIAALKACRERGIPLVAFSPIARAFLSGELESMEQMADSDIRRNMPRFHEPNWSKNLSLLGRYREIAADLGCSMAQLALAWCLAKGDDIIPIPGTKNIDHVAENFAAMDIELSDSIVAELDTLINEHTVSGHRYPEGQRAEIDSEEFDHQ